MADNDKLDRDLALQYAWRVKEPDPPGTDSRAAAPADAWPEAVHDAGLLAASVARAWAIPESDEQATATLALLGQAKAMGVLVIAMNAYPLESARLLRLALRHRLVIPDEDLGAFFGAAMFLLGYSHPEAAVALLEAVQTGDARLLQSFYFIRDPERIGELALVPGFVEKLAALVDDGPTWTARSLALMLACSVGGVAARPAIERALHGPHFGMRVEALRAMNERFPDALTPDHVLYLLRDMVDRPPPWGEDGVYEYPDLLREAVVRLRPVGGAGPLLRIVEGDCAYDGGSRVGVDAPWALQVAAAAYPLFATPFVDRWLRASDVKERAAAVVAAAELQDDDARSRLLRGARDGAPEVAEKARTLWSERYGTPCPVDDLAPLVGVDLLDHSPSDKLRERMPLLRGPREAREALAAALLAEAPDPEALALLLTILTDDVIASGPERAGLPAGMSAWFAEIATRFGGRGIAGVCDLALRFPESRFGWRYALAFGLVTAPQHYGPQMARALEAAWRCFEAWEDDREESYYALLLLAKIGHPPHARARLYAMALDEEFWEGGRLAAAESLGRAGEDASLDADVLRVMRGALGARDVGRLARAAEVGLARCLSEAETITQEAIAHFAWTEQDADVVEGELHNAFSHLLRLGRLTGAWVLEALGRPETGAFALALRHCRREPSPEVVLALTRALDSTARAGAAAAGAAEALVYTEHLSSGDPRLPGIAARAEPRAQASLLWMLVYKKAPIGPLREVLEGALTSEDPAVSDALDMLGDVLPNLRDEKWLLDILPRVHNAELRATLEARMVEAKPNWADGTRE